MNYKVNMLAPKNGVYHLNFKKICPIDLKFNLPEMKNFEEFCLLNYCLFQVDNYMQSFS